MRLNQSSHVALHLDCITQSGFWSHKFDLFEGFQHPNSATSQEPKQTRHILLLLWLLWLLLLLQLMFGVNSLINNHAISTHIPREYHDDTSNTATTPTSPHHQHDNRWSAHLSISLEYQIKSNQIKSNQIKSKSNQIKSNQNQIKSNQNQPNSSYLQRYWWVVLG